MALDLDDLKPRGDFLSTGDYLRMLNDHCRDGIITPEQARRALGFGDDDLPDEEEMKRRRALKAIAADLLTMTGPVASNHEPGCTSWLPTAPPCTCEGDRYVIVCSGPTRGDRRLRELHAQPANRSLLVWSVESTQRLRGMRWPFRLEILDWPDHHETAEAIRDALWLAGVPSEELWD